MAENELVTKSLNDPNEVEDVPPTEEPKPFGGLTGLGGINIPSISAPLQETQKSAEEFTTGISEQAKTYIDDDAGFRIKGEPVPTEVSSPPPPQAPPSGAVKTGQILTDPDTGEKVTFETGTPEGMEKLRKTRVDFAKRAEEIKVEKERLGQAEDLISSGMTFIQDVADPTTEDPIKTAEFNYAMSKLNPTLQANVAGTALRLKQAGIDPNEPGAGMAIMTQVARQANASVADVVGRLNVESANRIMEANRYGIELGMDVITHQQTIKRNNFLQGVDEISFLANTLKSTNPADYARAGANMNLPLTTDYTQLAKDVASANVADNGAATRALMTDYSSMNDMISGMVPGLDVNMSLLAGLPQEQVADIYGRLAQIQSDLQKSPPDKESARRRIQELQELYPNIVRGDYAQWDPDDFNSLGAFNRKQTNMTALSSMVFQAGENISDITQASEWAAQNMVDPETFADDWGQMWETMNPSQKRKNLEFSGIDPAVLDENGNLTEPLTDDEMKASLGGDLVRGIRESTNQTQLALNSMMSDNPQLKEWVLASPENENQMKAYLHSMLTGNVASLDENGNLKVDGGKILDPTNPDSDIAHYFFDWPVGFNAAGEWSDDPTQWIYSGNQPLSDKNFTAPADVAYQENVSSSWENYQRLGGEKNRMEWFTAAKPDVNGKPTESVPLTLTSDDFPTDVDLQRQFEIDTQKQVTDAVSAGDLSGITDLAVWKQIANTPALMSQILPMMEDLSAEPKYLRMRDWAASGLRADVVLAETDDKSIKQGTSAGSGQGSVVNINGTPHRIVQYRTKLDTTGDNERIGEYTVLNLQDGSKRVISTGWKETDSN